MATGLRKIIYIPNSEIWQGIQEAAWMDGRSVSNYLVTLYQVSVREGDTEKKEFFNPQPKGK
jgi:hypothetical protein